MHTPTPQPVSRRRVVQGIAWSTPAIAATVAAPAFAVSGPNCNPASAWNIYRTSLQASISLDVNPSSGGSVSWTISTKDADVSSTFRLVATLADGTRREGERTLEAQDIAYVAVYNVPTKDLVRVELQRLDENGTRVNIYELDTRSCAIIPTRSDMGEPFTPPADCDLRASWDEYLSQDRPDVAYTYDPVAQALTVVRFPSANPLPNELPVTTDAFDVIYTPRGKEAIRDENIAIFDGDMSVLTFPLSYPLEEITDLRVIRQQLFNDKGLHNYRWSVLAYNMGVGAFSCDVGETFVESAFINQEPWGIF